MTIVMKIMERIKLIRCALETKDKIVGKKFHYILIEGLRLLIRAIWLYKDKLKAKLGTIFGIVDKISEEFSHIRLENISEVYWIINLCKDEHKIFEMSFLFGLIVRV